MAEADITPPVGYRMAGYFDERFATEVHDPLQAKAFVLRQGRETVALIFCDLIGVSRQTTTNIRARLSRETGIPATHVLIAATHSHSGPLFDDVRRNFLHFRAVERHGKDISEPLDYSQFLQDRIIQAVREAHTRLAPASLETIDVRVDGLTFNRRYLMRDGRVQTNPGAMNTNILSAAGPVDADLAYLLARVRDRLEPLGGLAVFACHCDTVGGTQFSGDFPHYLCRAMKQSFGDQFVSGFAAGACGDINHIDVSRVDSVKGFAKAEQIGATLADRLLREMPSFRKVERPSLAVRSITLTVPLQRVSRKEVEEARTTMASLADPRVAFLDKVRAVKALDLNERGVTWPMEVQVFRLDVDTALVALPGEVFVELGLAIKRASPFRHTVVMSICNDRPGYVPTRKAFTEGGYEAINSRVEPGVGEQLVEAALELLSQIKHAP